MCVLDPKLKLESLATRGRALLGPDYPPSYNDPVLETTFFRDLDGTIIKFYTDHLPFKRCLSFHAKQVR